MHGRRAKPARPWPARTSGPLHTVSKEAADWHTIRTLLVVTPNDLVEPRIAEQLQQEQERARHAQRATNIMPCREGVHHVKQAGTAAAAGADAGVETEQQVEAAEEKVNVVEEGVLLHQAVVQWAVPEEEAARGDHDKVHKTADQVRERDKHTGDHVENQRAHECQPQTVHVAHDWLRVRRDLGVNVVVHNRVERRPVVAPKAAHVVRALRELAFALVQLLLAPADILHAHRVCRRRIPRAGGVHLVLLTLVVLERRRRVRTGAGRLERVVVRVKPAAAAHSVLHRGVVERVGVQCLSFVPRRHCGARLNRQGASAPSPSAHVAGRGAFCPPPTASLHPTPNVLWEHLLLAMGQSGGAPQVCAPVCSAHTDKGATAQ